MGVTLEQTLVLVMDLKTDINVVFRPFITEFLETLSLYFNITILSQIPKAIAEKILLHVDPVGKFIKKRVLLKNEGIGNKKMSFEEIFLGKSERYHSLLVRNTSDVCLKESKQEVLVKPWNNDEDDRILLQLMYMLKDVAISRVDNVGVFLENAKIRGPVM